jgi:hypothetical protein
MLHRSPPTPHAYDSIGSGDRRRRLLLEKHRTVLTDDPARAGEPGYVGRTEKADICATICRAGAGSSLIFAILSNRQATVDAATLTSTVVTHPAVLWPQAVCCCANTVPF